MGTGYDQRDQVVRSSIDVPKSICTSLQWSLSGCMKGGPMLPKGATEDTEVT